MHGFSLLELMVTITIIVLLFSISMPAYNLVKKRAYWAKTPGQMSKVVGAFHAYSADHNGYFPPAYFPTGADSASGTMDDNLEGASGWLNSTIYAQMYPDASVTSSSGDTGSGGADSTDGTTKSYEQSDKGLHLKDSVFEVTASALAFPEDDNLYNHSFLLNRSLATERAYNQNEFAPRKSTIYTDLSSIMLLIEGRGGDKFNSVAFQDSEGEDVQQGFDRYDGKFIHVGFMDGRVVQTKPSDFPKSPDESMGGSALPDAAFLFWRGVTRKEYDTLVRTDTGRVKY